MPGRWRMPRKQRHNDYIRIYVYFCFHPYGVTVLDVSWIRKHSETATPYRSFDSIHRCALWHKLLISSGLNMPDWSHKPGMSWRRRGYSDAAATPKFRRLRLAFTLGSIGVALGFAIRRRGGIGVPQSLFLKFATTITDNDKIPKRADAVRPANTICVYVRFVLECGVGCGRVGWSVRSGMEVG